MDLHISDVSHLLPRETARSYALIACLRRKFEPHWKNGKNVHNSSRVIIVYIPSDKESV